MKPAMLDRLFLFACSVTHIKPKPDDSVGEARSGWLLLFRFSRIVT